MKHTADIGINVLYEKVDHMLSTRDASCVYVWLLCVGGVGGVGGVEGKGWIKVRLFTLQLL